MLSLATRKRLAAPFYWLAGVFLTLANKVDGPQPRLAKTPREIVRRVYEMPAATKKEIIAAFQNVKPRKPN